MKLLLLERLSAHRAKRVGMVLAVQSAAQDNTELAMIQLLRSVSCANQVIHSRTLGNNHVLHVSQALTQA